MSTSTPTSTPLSLHARGLSVMQGVALYVGAVLGTPAALRSLPRDSWPHRCTRIALGAVAGLCCATGWYLLWPLAITGCTLLYLRLRSVFISRARSSP